jgi:hypothetical protein
MTTKTAAATSLDKLEIERHRLQEAISELDQQRAAQAKRLAAAQAAAARGGDAGEADQLEAEHQRLAQVAERLQRGLAAVEHDIQQAQEAERQAERESKEKRLASIRREAGRLCDALQADLTNREAWDKLVALYREHLQLRVALYGHDVLSRPASSPWDWLAPAEGLARFFAAVNTLAFGNSQPPEHPEAYRVLRGRDWTPPAKTLREALGL